MAFRKSGSKKIGLKFLCVGETGCGKSYFGLTFPNVGCIDTETGIALYENKDIEINGKIYNNIKFVDNTCDIETIEEDLDAVLDGEFDGEIDTFVVDSESKIYGNLVVGATEEGQRKAKINGKSFDQRKMYGDVKLVNTKLQQAKITLSAKGINVVSMVQSSWQKDDDTKQQELKLECHKSLPFDYDIVLRFYKDVDKKTKEIKFYAETLKDRTNVTKVGQIIENATFDIWSDYSNGLSKLDSMEADFVQDLKNASVAVRTQVEKNENMANEIKKLLKGFEAEQQKQAKSKIDELGISLKELSNSETDKLTELLSYLKTL